MTKVRQRAWGDDYTRLLADLRAVAPMYFYDYPNRITENTANFRDAVHFRDDVADSIVMEVFGGMRWLAQYSEPDSQNISLLNSASAQRETDRTISIRPFVAQCRRNNTTATGINP